MPPLTADLLQSVLIQLRLPQGPGQSAPTIPKSPDCRSFRIEKYESRVGGSVTVPSFARLHLNAIVTCSFALLHA